jgi:hypothetical protein
MTASKNTSTQDRNKTRKQALPNTIELSCFEGYRTFKTNRIPADYIKRRIENLLFWIQINGLNQRANEGIMGSVGVLVWDELSEGLELKGKQYLRLDIFYKQYKEGSSWVVELSPNFTVKILERTAEGSTCLDPVVAEYRFSREIQTSLGRASVKG